MRIPHGLRAALAGQGSTPPPTPTTDANFRNTVLLLHGDGTNGAQNNTFTDSSTNNFTITRSGNATQGTFSPYGDNWSNYFDGTGDFLTAANNSAFALPGDFTIELWANFNSNTSSVFCGNINGSGYGDWAFFYNSAVPGIRFVTDNGATTITGTHTATIGVWTHYAITRSGSDVKIFANGSLLSTTTNSSSNSFAGTLYVGRANDGSLQFPGYISNLRIVKGTAVYTSNFTPSTTPLTAITNTSLLTCQSNRFRDASTNNFTITRNGDVSVQRFSPFSPAAAYSSSTIGGSGYFDGSGDNVYCTPSNLTGQFTIEGWFYQTDNAGTKAFFGNWTTGCLFRVQSVTSLQWYMPGSSLTATIVSQKNQWCHAAITRDSGNTVRLFLNGTQVASNTSSSTITMTNFTVGSERSVSGDQYAGYISGFRILNGTALYTSAFTPPTTPPTAITNTNLLLNFTNGGIIDNTMMNDLETVGNAQISTSVKKYGTGSLAFDGTGDYLKLSNNAAGQAQGFGTGDFTIEAWVYITSSTAANNGIYDCRYSSSATGPLIYYIPGSGMFMFYNGANQITGSTITINTWTHVALVRSSGVTKLYLSGTQTGSSYTDTNNYTSGANSGVVGAVYDGTGSWNGYIDDLRITKGVARYTANFTPPTAALPDL
jgi:hypothetical protein